MVKDDKRCAYGWGLVNAKRTGGGCVLLGEGFNEAKGSLPFPLRGCQSSDGKYLLIRCIAGVTWFIFPMFSELDLHSKTCVAASVNL